MRIRCAFILTLLWLTRCAFSQSWGVVDPFAYNDETVVYATLSSNVESDPMSDFVLGAFIDGTCRAEAVSPVLGRDGAAFFILRVGGDKSADLGKEISFRAYHKPTGKTYDLTPERVVVYSGESEGSPSRRIVLSLMRDEEELVPLESLFVMTDPLAAGRSTRLLLQPVPADASFDLYALDLSFTGSISGWTPMEVGRRGMTKNEADINCVYFDVTPLYPGVVRLSATLGDKPIPLLGETGGPLAGLEVGMLLDLHPGWQWRSNAWGDLTPGNVFRVLSGNELVEVRTQSGLLYNDPTWGYFGTLMETGVAQNTCYKVKMGESPTATVLMGGHYETSWRVVLDGEWTWVGVPYFYDRPLSVALNPEQQELPEGLTIVTKENGSAEYSGGRWIGDLTVLRAGEGVMVYSPLDEPYTLTFADETSMEQGARSMEQGARSTEHGASYWQYDASRFMNNTTMVAELAEPVSFSPDWSVGVFVGSECRGEGHYVDGRFFITAHTDRGERVSLKLRHAPTSYVCDVDETLMTGAMRIGSLRTPVQLHSGGVVTEVRAAGYGVRRTGSVVSNLRGQRVSSATRGVLLVRQPDGSVRKVIRK